MSNKETRDNTRIGGGKAGPGRPKGVPNKTTASVKAALCEAFEKRGGVEALLAWAATDETEFYKLWARLAPAEIHMAGKDGGALELRIRVVKE